MLGSRCLHLLWAATSGKWGANHTHVGELPRWCLKWPCADSPWRKACCVPIPRGHCADGIKVWTLKQVTCVSHVWACGLLQQSTTTRWLEGQKRLGPGLGSWSTDRRPSSLGGQEAEGRRHRTSPARPLPGAGGFCCLLGMEKTSCSLPGCALSGREPLSPWQLPFCRGGRHLGLARGPRLSLVVVGPLCTGRPKGRCLGF